MPITITVDYGDEKGQQARARPIEGYSDASIRPRTRPAPQNPQGTFGDPRWQTATFLRGLAHALLARRAAGYREYPSPEVATPAPRPPEAPAPQARGGGWRPVSGWKEM